MEIGDARQGMGIAGNLPSFVTEMLPNVTESSLLFPPARSGGTNPPISHALKSRQSSGKASAASSGQDKQSCAGKMLPDVTASSRMFPSAAVGGTNPTLDLAVTTPVVGENALSDRQRAAARLLAAGKRVRDVAAQVGITRQ